MMKRNLFVILFILMVSAYGQISPDLINQLKNMKGISVLPNTDIKQYKSITTTTFQNIQNLDPSRYIVNPGDILYAKIDFPGPDYSDLDIPVTGEGYALLPQGNSIHVKGMILKEVYSALKINLQKLYRNSIIEIYLKQPRSVKINIDIANLKRLGFLLPATFKFSDVPVLLPQELTQDSVFNADSLISRRFLFLFREGKQRKIDLFRIFFLNDSTEDGYIREGDYFYVPFAEDPISRVYLSGEVNRPGFYEVNQGDRFSDLLIYAGGLRENADSSKVEIHRKVGNTSEDFLLKKEEWANFKIMPGDRIYIRSRIHPDTDWKVMIQGEVTYPGEYSIVDDKTTIYELIQKAGGFTQRASLNDALIIREKFIPEDKEYARLKRLSVDEMSRIEKSYYKIRNRQDIRKVVCNFENLFRHKKMEENVALRDGDVIIVPPKNPVVIISGGVMNPGVQTFRDGYNYKKYIKLSGGFSPRARKNKVKIIKPKQGLWLDAKEDVVLEPGDIIFIPEKEERDWWEMFKEGLTILTQLSTLALVILNLKNLAK